MVVEQTKHRPPYSRDEYPTVPRHPVALLCWNHKETNTGGLIRAAEAFMAEHVYFVMAEGSLAYAMGAEKWQPHTFGADPEEVMARYRRQGYKVVALEQTDASRLLHQVELPEKVLLLIGAEKFGVPDWALEQADLCVEIPLWGFVASLNVHVAATVFMYEWVRQWDPVPKSVKVRHSEVPPR